MLLLMKTQRLLLKYINFSTRSFDASFFRLDHLLDVAVHRILVLHAWISEHRWKVVEHETHINYSYLWSHDEAVDLVSGCPERLAR
jgi:hypothetical protein